MLSYMKRHAFDRNFSDEEYALVFDGGRHEQFMRCGYKNFFISLEYKNQFVKDFKRITLYVCTLSDHMIAEDLINPCTEASDVADNVKIATE